MTPARISPFDAPSTASPSSPASPSDPDILPRLERVLGTLDELLEWLHVARQSGESLTGGSVFGRELEQAANELSEVCDDLKGAGHE